MCERGTTAPLWIGSEAINVDACILPIVAALNAGGVRTVASCCGHGRYPGRVALDDGRELVVVPDFDTASALHRPLIVTAAKRIEELIAASSFGGAGAMARRGEAPQDVIDRILEKVTDPVFMGGDGEEHGPCRGRVRTDRRA